MTTLGHRDAAVKGSAAMPLSARSATAHQMGPIYYVRQPLAGQPQTVVRGGSPSHVPKLPMGVVSATQPPVITASAAQPSYTTAWGRTQYLSPQEYTTSGAATVRTQRPSAVRDAGSPDRSAWEVRKPAAAVPYPMSARERRVTTVAGPMASPAVEHKEVRPTGAADAFEIRQEAAGGTVGSGTAGEMLHLAGGTAPAAASQAEHASGPARLSHAGAAGRPVMQASAVNTPGVPARYVVRASPSPDGTQVHTYTSVAAAGPVVSQVPQSAQRQAAPLQSPRALPVPTSYVQHGCPSPSRPLPSGLMSGRVTPAVAAALLSEAEVQKAMSMLPQSPPNTLTEFINSVALPQGVAGKTVPAMCQGKISIDVQGFWDKRRVQNLLRRLRESLQDNFDPGGADIAAVAFHEMVRWAQPMGLLQSGPDVEAAPDAPPAEPGFAEAALNQTLEKLNLWPPELSPGDRSEVFTALRVPSMDSVRALHVGRPLRKRVTQRLFCEALCKVPFNLPDFPVPTHLLTNDSSIDSKQVAQAIASTFAAGQVGLEGIQDFWLSGLVSLEEIQLALPFLVKHSMVEDAVLRIIRTGAAALTQQEWRILVHDVRERVGCAPPQMEQRAIDTSQAREPEPQLHSAHDFGAQAPSQGVAAAPPDHGGAESARWRPLPAGVATEPVPHRDLHSRAIVSGGGRPVVINWNTTQRVGGGQDPEDGHQADEGAGLRDGTRPPGAGDGIAASSDSGSQPAEAAVRSWGSLWSQAGPGAPGSPLAGGGHLLAQEGVQAPAPLQTPPHQQTPPQPQPQLVLPEVDPVRYISMGKDLPNDECLGPFLAVAFVRCCELYHRGAGIEDRH